MFFSDGKVCLSVLHPPGTDQFDPGETPEMRWLPIHTVSSILQCFISILDHPGGAPANVDAQSEYNNNRNAYNTRVRAYAAESKKTVPARIKIPHPDTDPNDPTYQKRVRKLHDEFKSNTTSLYDDDGYDDGDGDYGFDYDYDGVEYDESGEAEVENDD